MIPIKSILVFLIIIVSVGILFMLGLVIMESMGSSEISESELSEGVSFILGQGKETAFSLNEELHKLIINSIGEGSVEITIQSQLIYSTLSIGETKKLDLNSDGTYDLLVKLNRIDDGKANIFIQKISEACTEDWVCSEWSNCTESIQTRTCEDSNDCGTGNNKPDETRECEVSEPVSSLNCSLGTQTDIDCFVYYAQTCTPSSITYGFSINLLGWVQTNSYYYEIKNFAEDKCELYEKIISNSGVYSDVKRQYFSVEENKTEEQITEMEADKNDDLADLVGKYGTCRYSLLDLEVTLTELKNVGMILPISDPELYACTGSLYELNLTITNSTDSNSSNSS